MFYITRANKRFVAETDIDIDQRFIQQSKTSYLPLVTVLASR